MDEPLHVVISACNTENFEAAMNRVQEVFLQPDLARRLALKNSVPFLVSSHAAFYGGSFAQPDRAGGR